MTITLTREEAQKILDAFENWDASGRLRLIEALRAALAQPEPEPVAWVWEINESSQLFLTLPQGWNPIPLYTAPPQRNEPEHRDVVIKGDLWRIEFLPDHAASVVLVKANYEAQPEPVSNTYQLKPVAWMYEFFADKGNKGLAFEPQPYADNTPLYEAQPPCQTCVSLARAVMMDQVGRA